MDHVRISVLACMVLHNICIMRGDTISKKLDLTFNPDNNERRDREEVRKLLQMRKCQKTPDVSKEAKKIRNALSDKLWTEKETGKVC